MNIFSYDQLRQYVDTNVPNHLVVSANGSRWYDYANAVAEICTAFNQPADGWMAPFIEGIVADAVEDAYGAPLPAVTSVQP